METRTPFQDHLFEQAQTELEGRSVEDCDLIIQYRIYELCNHHVYDIQFLITLSVVVYYTVYNNNSFKNLVVLYI